MPCSSFRYRSSPSSPPDASSPRRSGGCINISFTRSCRQTLTDPAWLAARRIAGAFVEYNAEFRAITRRAPARFDSRDWKSSQRDAVERIELYERFVARTIAELKALLGERAEDRDLWTRIRAEFAARIEGLPDAEFTKTFFSSISRRLFGTIGVAPEIEFVATDLDPLAHVTSTVTTNTYINHGSLALLFEDVLGDVRFSSPWKDLDNSIRHVTTE